MRVYTEWCCEGNQGCSASYGGGAFDVWVKDETHYALERAGYNVKGPFRFDPKPVGEKIEGGAVGAVVDTANSKADINPGADVNSGEGETRPEVTSDIYKTMREKVLRAVARRACAYSKLCGERGFYPLPGNSQNLRGPLGDFIADIEHGPRAPEVVPGGFVVEDGKPR